MCLPRRGLDPRGTTCGQGQGPPACTVATRMLVLCSLLVFLRKLEALGYLLRVVGPGHTVKFHVHERCFDTLVGMLLYIYRERFLLEPWQHVS